MWIRDEGHGKIDQRKEKLTAAVAERTHDEGLTAKYRNGHGSGFLLGLIAGAAVGAGLGLLFAPRAGSELRGRLAELPANLGDAASKGYRQASARVGAAVDALVDKGQSARGKAWEAVARGARDVEAYANEGNISPQA